MKLIGSPIICIDYSMSDSAIGLVSGHIMEKIFSVMGRDSFVDSYLVSIRESIL